MTVTVANSAITNTLDYMRNRVNELAASMSNVAVTVNSNTAVGNAAITGTFSANVYVAGNSSVNATINGATSTVTANAGVYITVSANTITVGNSTVNVTANSTYLKVGGQVAVGNSTVNVAVTQSALTLANSTASLALTVPNTTAIASGNYFLNANGSYVQVLSAATPISSGGTTTAGTSQQVIDSYPIASNFSAEYQVHVKSSVTNAFSVAKLLTFHDTGSGYVTEYATMNSNGAIGVWNAFTNATHVVLSLTPTVSAATVKFTRVLI